MEKIIIIGSGGHAKVIIDILIKQNKYKIIGLLDDFKNIGVQVMGHTVLGGTKDLPQLIGNQGITGAIIAIGDNFSRAQTAKNIQKDCPEITLINAIHPSATIAKHAIIEEGAVIMAGVTIGPFCKIGKHCILNTQSSLDHDSVMGDFSSLAPRAVTGGNCKIGAYSAICIGATLLNNINIGDHTIVGAASLVLKDIESYTIAYGAPAKSIRKRSESEKYL